MAGRFSGVKPLADTVNRPHSRLVADKHRIERELMNLVIDPDKAAIDA
jgi:hypothetical protein